MHTPSIVVSAALLWAAPVVSALAQEPQGIVHFSAAKPGTELPKGWESVKINENKKPTEYKFVSNDGATVLEANAVAGASGMAQRMPIDASQWPIVEWRWKISRLIETADNSVGAKEDSPVRLIFEFDGDKKK